MKENIVHWLGIVIALFGFTDFFTGKQERGLLLVLLSCAFYIVARLMVIEKKLAVPPPPLPQELHAPAGQRMKVKSLCRDSDGNVERVIERDI